MLNQTKEKNIWSEGGWWRAPNAVYDHWSSLGFKDGDGKWRSLTAIDQVIYLCLYRHADDSMSCFPSFDTLARETGVCRNSAVAAITHLQKAGLIEKQRRRGAGQRYTSNLYTILPLPISFARSDSARGGNGDGARDAPGSAPDGKEEDPMKKTNKEEEGASPFHEKTEETPFFGDGNLAKAKALLKDRWQAVGRTTDPGKEEEERLESTLADGYTVEEIFDFYDQKASEPRFEKKPVAMRFIKEDIWEFAGASRDRRRQEAKERREREEEERREFEDLRRQVRGEEPDYYDYGDIDAEWLRRWLAEFEEWKEGRQGKPTEEDLEQFRRKDAENRGLGHPADLSLGWYIPRRYQKHASLKDLSDDLDAATG